MQLYATIFLPLYMLYTPCSNYLLPIRYINQRSVAFLLDSANVICNFFAQFSVIHTSNRFLLWSRIMKKWIQIGIHHIVYYLSVSVGLLSHPIRAPHIQCVISSKWPAAFGSKLTEDSSGGNDTSLTCWTVFSTSIGFSVLDLMSSLIRSSIILARVEIETWPNSEM